MNYLKLQFDKLSVDEIKDLVSAPDCGAISLFLGTTRDNIHDKKVTRLEYEAYESMAIKEMERVCTEVRQKWPDIRNIAIYHRLGQVVVKEESIVIAISSPHRKESLEAVNYCINEVKRSVPVWKKEWYEDGSYVWKENCECKWKKAE